MNLNMSLKLENLICALQTLQSLFTNYWIFVVSKKKKKHTRIQKPDYNRALVI